MSAASALSVFVRESSLCPNDLIAIVTLDSASLARIFELTKLRLRYAYLRIYVVLRYERYTGYAAGTADDSARQRAFNSSSSTRMFSV